MRRYSGDMMLDKLMTQPSSESSIASGIMQTKLHLKSLVVVACLLVLALPALILFSRHGKSRDAAKAFPVSRLQSPR